MSRVTTAHFEARTLFAPTFRLRATPPFLFNETRDLSLPSILTILPVVEIRPFIRPVITAEDKKETGERERDSTEFGKSVDVFRRSKRIERRETGVEQGGKGVKSRQGIKVGKLILIAGNKSFLSDRVMLFRSLRCSLLSALAPGKKIISDQHADSWSRAEKREWESVWCRESKAAVVARFLENGRGRRGRRRIFSSSSFLSSRSESFVAIFPNSVNRLVAARDQLCVGHLRFKLFV